MKIGFFEYIKSIELYLPLRLALIFLFLFPDFRQGLDKLAADSGNS